MMYLAGLAAASILGLSLAGCSLLKPHYNDAKLHHYLFEKFDGNGNGIITETEYFSFIDERFDKMNPDGGQTITKEELYNTRFYMFLPVLAQAVFRDSDSDADGLITREEMVAAEKVRFKQMDVDKDGRLSSSELLVNDRSEFR